MKFSFNLNNEEGRRTVYFLRAFFGKPEASLSAVAKLAVLEVASQQARIELADAARVATVEGAEAMKHPDKIKAEECEREAVKVDTQAEAFISRAGSLRGVSPELAAAYDEAADALKNLAGELIKRAKYFDDSARIH